MNFFDVVNYRYDDLDTVTLRRNVNALYEI